MPRRSRARVRRRVGEVFYKPAKNEQFHNVDNDSEQDENQNDALHDKDDLSPQNILSMQRALGNRAVSRIIAQQEDDTQLQDDESQDNAEPQQGDVQNENSLSNDQQEEDQAPQNQDDNANVNDQDQDQQNALDDEAQKKLEETKAKLTVLKTHLAALKVALDKKKIPDDFNKTVNDALTILKELPLGDTQKVAVTAFITRLAKHMSDSNKVAQAAGAVQLQQNLKATAIATDGSPHTGVEQTVNDDGFLEVKGTAPGKADAGRQFASPNKSADQKIPLRLRNFLGLLINSNKDERDVASIYTKMTGSTEGTFNLGGGMVFKGDFVSSLKKIKARILADSFIKSKSMATGPMKLTKGTFAPAFFGKGQIAVGNKERRGLVEKLEEGALEISLKLGAFNGVRATTEGLQNLKVGSFAPFPFTGAMKYASGSALANITIGTDKTIMEFLFSAGVPMGIVGEQGMFADVGGVLNLGMLGMTSDALFDTFAKESTKQFGTIYTAMSIEEHQQMVNELLLMMEQQLAVPEEESVVEENSDNEE